VLKRKDLSKEFALVVQQEIKNHNDAVLECNIAVESLCQKLKDVDANVSKRHNDSKIAIENLHETIKFLYKKGEDSLSQAFREIHDLEKESKENFSCFKDIIDKRDSYFLSVDGFKAFENKIDQWLAQVKGSFSRQKEYLEEKIGEVSLKLYTLIGDVEQQCLKELSTEKDKRQEIDAAIDLNVIHLAGIKKENDINKKDIYLLQKNIENIYTQIERISNKLSALQTNKR